MQTPFAYKASPVKQKLKEYTVLENYPNKNPTTLTNQNNHKINFNSKKSNVTISLNSKPTKKFQNSEYPSQL